MRRLLLLLSLVLVAAACGGDDASDDGSDASSTGGFSLSSSAFGDGELIPAEYARDGGDQSPPLRWAGAPAGTEELALAVVDPDASNFVHWVIADLEPASDGLDAGEVPPGAVQALNSFGEPGWSGPAPPAGTRHTYVFTLYALPEPSDVTDDMEGTEAIDLLEEKANDRTELRGEYESPS